MRRPTSSIFVLAVPSLLLVFHASVARGDWPADPMINVPVCALSGGQGSQAIAADGQGGAVLAWHDGRPAASVHDIYAQRMSASGNPQWAANGTLVCAATGDQLNPATCSDGSRGAIIAWQDARSGSSDVYAQRLDASGSALWTSDGVGVCLATGGQGIPAIAADGSGGAFIAWADSRAGISQVFAQRVNASGTALWTSNGVQVSTSASSVTNARLIADGSGGMIVTWKRRRDLRQRLNASGTPLWTSGGVVICPDAFNQKDAFPATDGAGGVIVIYNDPRRGANMDVYAQRIGSAGAPLWTANGVLLCDDAAIHDDPGGIVADGSGGIIAAFRHATSDIRAQRVNASGAIQWGTTGVVVCAATGVQDRPRLVVTSDGALASWRDARAGNEDLYAQRLSLAGAPQWTANGRAISTALGTKLTQVMASDAADGAIIAWQDQRTDAQGDVYAQRITLTGLLGSNPCDLSVTPASGYAVQGPPGGPFTPASSTYTLASGANGFNYQITRTASWLLLNGATSLSGSLTANSTLPVVVSLGASANALPLGVYADTVRFFQVGTGVCTFARPVSLTVGSMGITSLVPATGLTTAFAFANPDTVIVLGQLFGPGAGVAFGGFAAQVFRAAPTNDSLYVILPPYPPGGDCALQTVLPVPVTVTAGTQTVTSPSPFQYTIVKAQVPEAYPTIQAAVNAAIPGTCISVAAGAYVENVDMSPGGSPRNKVTLMSRTPTQTQKTRLQGGTTFTPLLPTVRFSHNDSLTILRGFEIVLGNSGVLVRDTAGVQILDNAIRDNFATGSGGGIAVLLGSYPTIRGNRIDQNEADGHGGGLAVIGARASISDDNLLGNIAGGDGGGAYLETGTPMRLVNVRLYDNSAHGNGGGVATKSRGALVFDSCSVLRNSSGGTGGGYHLDRAFPASILRNQIDDNSSGSDGGAIYVRGLERRLDLRLDTPPQRHRERQRRRDVPHAADRGARGVQHVPGQSAERLQRARRRHRHSAVRDRGNRLERLLRQPRQHRRGDDHRPQGDHRRHPKPHRVQRRGTAPAFGVQ